MKKRSSLVAASIAVTFMVLSSSTFAGGDCIYGHDAKIAASDAAVIDDTTKVDPSLLALLKKQQDKQIKTTPIATFH